MPLFGPNVEEMERERNIDGLTNALKHRNNNVRRKAADALGRIGDAKAVEPLIQTLKDSDINVVWEAMTALAKVGEPALDPLTQLLKDKDISLDRQLY